jgi:malate dehydrogenase (oxaloacetate-decarboxylating)(NADP+)
MFTREEALEYHRGGRPGKIEIRCTKPTLTQRDLSLAYTPGVAEPCLDIAKLPAMVDEYTARANLVAVVSNGSAVLGLGNIGPRAGKPVMEGKAVLFKRFADVDVFDIEIDAPTPGEFIDTVLRLEPTFGGINIEDVRAPECFEIEETLEAKMDIPVFHDDQHGTAIISGAALLNACDLVGKDPSECRIVINGAGAAAISGAKLYEALGFVHENIWMCDSKGVVYAGRENLNPYKDLYAHPDDGRHTLAEIAEGTDILIGLSTAGLFTQDMIRRMARDPIVFAMANPWPEIMPEEAHAVRDDLIMGTGRSDFPNQVNNVLGFPFIFRGALDTRAKAVTTEMKVAAARALADLARETVPEAVSRAYGGERFQFGRDYLIPKPFDPRVLLWESHAVARAAIEGGVARREVDLDEYREELAHRIDPKRAFVLLATAKTRAHRPTVVFPESMNDEILHAVQLIDEERIADVKLLGNPRTIEQRANEVGAKLGEAQIIDPKRLPELETLVRLYQESTLGRGKDDVTARQEILADHLVCAVLMLKHGEADVLIAGTESPYPQAARKLLRVMETERGAYRASGMHLVRLRDRTLLFADTTLNISPDAETLAGIAIDAAAAARRFEVDPVIGMLSFSNFGESDHPEACKVAEAVRIIRTREPDLPVIGEIQADWAVKPDEFEGLIPKGRSVGGSANVLIFPNLSAANIGFRLVRALGEGDVIGPVMLGLPYAVGLLPRGVNAMEIARMTAIAGFEALSDR